MREQPVPIHFNMLWKSTWKQHQSCLMSLWLLWLLYYLNKAVQRNKSRYDHSDGLQSSLQAYFWCIEINGNNWLPVKLENHSCSLKMVKCTSNTQCVSSSNNLRFAGCCLLALCLEFRAHCGPKCDLVQLWAVSAERPRAAADAARRPPVGGQRVYVGQPRACMLWQQQGHCAVQPDADWSGQRGPAWREAPRARHHRYFLICPLKHFDIIRPHRATSTLITLTFGNAAKWAKRRRNRQKYWGRRFMVHVGHVGMVIWWLLSRQSHDTSDVQLQQLPVLTGELCDHMTARNSPIPSGQLTFRFKEGFKK